MEQDKRIIFEEKLIAEKLQDYPENQLTKKFIIPVLSKLYFKVEWYGGPGEKGKDIVIWAKDELEDIKLIVAQVKPFPYSNTASDPKGFPGIVTQLTQCLRKRVQYVDKTSHLPSQVLLINTHPVPSKSLETIFNEQCDPQDQKIKIIDGQKLAQLLNKHCPDLTTKLLGIKTNISSFQKHYLNNQILLKALGFQKKIEIQKIYTDIDFSLGKRTTKLFFNAHFKPSVQELKLNKSEWENFKYLCKKIKPCFSLKYIDKSINKIEEETLKLNKHHIKWSQLLEKIIRDFENESIESESLNNKLNEIEKKIITPKEIVIDFLFIKRIKHIKIENIHFLPKFDQIKKSKNYVIEKLIEIRPLIDEIIQQSKQNKMLTESLKEWEHLHNTKVPLESIIEKQDRKISRLEDGIQKHKDEEPKPMYCFKLNGKILVELIKDKRKWIEESVNHFNSIRANDDEIKKFIIECKSIIEIASIIFTDSLLSSCIGESEKKIYRKDFESTRFRLPIESVFNTGINILLLGDAGAGKTTNLQMYALNKQMDNEKTIIWAPLSNVVQYIKTSKKRSLKNLKIEKIFDDIIINYVISKYHEHTGIIVSKSDFLNELKSRKTILLLDGIDEAIKSVPKLPECIQNLSEKFKNNMQIIVSSRMSGSYIERIPFTAITLLEFTDEQRNQFVKNWFKSNNDVVKKIKNHLKINKSINEITRNPLLTTLLCVLADNNLPLPTNEINLYNNRIRLLSGYYDRVKNIENRMSFTPEVFETLSQNLAFYLHKNYLRENSLTNLYKEALKFTNDIKKAECAVNELIEPCNILVPMTDDGKFGFGHLRFQEHLAAKYIISDRSISIVRLINDTWWRDSLILFAQMNNNLDWIIEDIVKYGGEITEEVRVTIAKMIETRPPNEREQLNQDFEKHLDITIDIEAEDFYPSDDLEIL